MKILAFSVFLFFGGLSQSALADVEVEFRRPVPLVFNYDTTDAQTGNPVIAPWFQTNVSIANLTSKDLNLTSIVFLLTSVATGEQSTKSVQYPTAGVAIGAGLTQILPLTIDGLIQGQFVYDVKATLLGIATLKNGTTEPFAQDVYFQTKKF